MIPELDAIKARAEAATDGPWRVISDYIPGVIEVEGPTASNDYVAELSADKADLEFIAHARQDIPALAAAVEAVLELHKPITDDGNSLRNWLGMGNGKPRDYCNECEVDGYTAVPYPCPTVTAIQSALGEGEQ
jgi:hypothetical protein